MTLKQNKKNAIALAKDQRRKKWKSEMIFKKMLNREGVQHVHQKPFYSDSWFFVGDFYIPKLKILIEIDGKNHKKKKDQIRINKIVESYSINRLIRIKNSDLINRPRYVYKKVIEIRNELWDTNK